MSKQSLLLVDGDPRSLRVLEVSLRKAGFSVTTAESARAAQEKIVVGAPDLIISEIKLDDGDGFELCRRVRSTPEWQDIPFMFLTGEVGIENKIRGLELGVDEYLTKPIYIKEIVTRIHMLLQKRQRARIEERKDQRTRFVGRIADMPVVDVIQTIEVSRKSGVIHFIGERNHQAAIYFRDGKVIDAEAGPLTAEDAVYRLLTWSEGDFEVVFRTVRRREVIQIGSQALLMEGMRRLDEWTRLLEQLPPLSTHMDLKLDQLAKKLGEIPDESNRLLRLIDGKRSLMAVIDACDLGDLEALQAIAQLHGQGLLVEVEASAAEEDEGRPRLSLESVVARARGEESGPFSVPSTTPPSMPAVSSTLSAVAELAAGTTSGGFRPSGLRLVDEAVAAAQAIDPELAAWPDAGSVARTITGRARTISQITSFGLERAPDAPQLPQVKQRVAAQYEVQAPTRARTEPGLGSSPLAPAPAQEPARPAAQFAAAVPPEVPRRSRSITGQAMALSPRAAKTPPYGAPVSGAPRGQDDATPQVLVSEPSAKIVAEITAPRTAVRTFAALVEPSSAQAPSSSAQAPQAAATGPKARATTASDGVRATSEPGSARTDETVKERASSEQGTQPPRGEPESAFELANSDDDAALTRRRDAVLSVIQTKGTPLVARANTRPGSLPPGSGTSVALARKRRSSPPPPSRTVTPTGDGARPATLARITTEQRAVRVSEVAGPRRETRRMITSLGAATAEVSGEVEAPVIATEAQSETQRQMVTILPRRITREVPLVEAPVEVAPELSGPGRPNPRVEGKPREASAQAPGSESGPTQRRTTRELPAEPGIEVTSRAPRPTLVRRRVTEPEVLTPKSPAAVASRRITREVPAAAAIDAVEPALTAGEVAGEAVSDERRSSSGVIGAAAGAAGSSPVAQREAAAAPDTAEAAAEAVAEPGPEADADPVATSRDDKSVADNRLVSSRLPVESLPGAAAVTPSWSAAERSTTQRTTAILFGLSGVLAIAATAAWLRGRAADRTPPPRTPSGEIAPPPAPGVAPCPEPAPANDGCPPKAPKGAQHPAGSAAASGGAAATPPEPASAAASAAGDVVKPAPALATGGAPAPAGLAAKPDPGKEAKALLAKARKAMAEGNPTGALLYADEALALKKSARAHLARASALQGLVRLDDALSAVDRAIAMSDGYAEGWLVRGRVLEALGRSGEAKAAFARFLELSPSGAAADDVRRRLGL